MKQVYKLLLAVIIFIASIPTIKAQVNTKDSLALVDLYDSCGGQNWTNHTNWLTSAPVSSWIGVTESGNRVTSLVLSSNQLTGTIPTSIGNLSGSTVLELDANQLIGTIPDTIGSLNQLNFLSLANNQLSGTIPTSLGSLTNLTVLYVDHNQLTGSIPSSLGKLTNLNYLNLNDNQLSGTIPSSLGNLINVSGLALNNNQLTGVIPSSFGSLISMYILDVSNNQLSGNIPTTFSKLSNLYELSISSNKITGNLPSFIGHLNNLVYLYVDNNGLTGPIPSSLANLTRLKALSLQNNQFTFNGMEGIDTLPIQNKYYSPQATIPLYNNIDYFSVSAGGTLANDTFRWYKDTGLVATIVGDSTFIPSTDGKYWATVTNAKVKNLTLYADTLYVQWAPVKQDSLALVDLYKSTNGANWVNHTNWLTKAPISSWYGITKNAGRVTDIALFNNNLSGKLLPSMGDLTGLKQISLHFGTITDTIPATIGNLKKLINLDLGANKFTGTIPATIGNMTALQEIDLSNNNLSGSIPTSVGNLTNLVALWLEFNNLTGSIPSTMGSMVNLNNLVLQNNLLSGSIPTMLGNLPKLANIFLQNNQLSGSIPASLGNLTNLKQLYLQNNQFTFDGMELIAKKFPFAQYAPQAPIKLYKAVNNKGDTILKVRTGCTPANGLYQWYNNNQLAATIYVDSTYKVPAKGNYSVQSADALLPFFVLYSDTLMATVSIQPIKAIYLQAIATNNKIQLNWQTIQEINTQLFMIERSHDGVNFTDMGTTTAVGKGNNSYYLVDVQPFEGINYYRIKTIDKDGSVGFSTVVRCEWLVVSKQFTVYPNPAKDNVTVMGNHIASIQVMDDLGRVVGVKSCKDATNAYVEVRNLPSGVYYMLVKTTEGKVSELKMVKE